MRVAIITAFDPYEFKGGIERYTLELITLLSETGITTDVFHTGLVDNELEFYNPFLGRVYMLGRQFMKIDKHYDFLISNSFYGLGYFPPRIASFTIYHSSHVSFDKASQGVISPVTSLEWTYLCGYLGEMASGFNRRKIAVSDEVKAELERHYGFTDVHVVESCVDTDMFRPKKPKEHLRTKYSLSCNSFIGLFVGRWDKTKGSDIVEKVIEGTPDIRWLLVLGTGSEECMFKRAKNVTVLEEVPYEEMPTIYSLSDFVFFPSRYEGCGLVILEAMSCGLPVLTGEVGVAKKIYSRDPFSALKLPAVSQSNREELINESIKKIYQLRENGEWRTHISDAGIKLVRERYNLTNWKTNMLKALNLDRVNG